MKSKKAQIWIETVIYTLIGLALIGLILAFVMPKINESKDKLVIEQSIDSLNKIADTINEIWFSPGNQRSISLTVKRGDFFVDTVNDQLGFFISDLKKTYSQVDTPIQTGKITILSKTNQKSNSVYLTLNYSSQLNVTFNGNDNPINKEFTPASMPYNLLIKSKGDINAPSSDLFVIDITN